MTIQQKLAMATHYAEYDYATLSLASDTYQQLRQAWRRLAGNAQAPVFAYPEWLESAMRIGALPPIRVVLISYGDRPVALLPLLRRGPLCWETVAFLAHDGSQMLIDPELEGAAWLGVTAWIAHAPGVGRVALGPCTSQPRIERFLTAMKLAGLAGNAELMTPTMRVPLAADWDAFLHRLGPALSAKYRRVETHMREAYPESVLEMIARPEESDDALESLVRLYCRCWGNQPGHCLLCDPQNITVFRRVLEWALRHGVALVPELRLGGRTLAVGAVLHIPGQSSAYFHFAGQDLTRLPRHWLNAPGTMLAAQVIRWAMARGARELLTNAGHDQYKLLLGGESLDRWQLVAARSSLADTLLTPLERTCAVGRRLPSHASHHLQHLAHRHCHCATMHCRDFIEE